MQQRQLDQLFPAHTEHLDTSVAGRSEHLDQKVISRPMTSRRWTRSRAGDRAAAGNAEFAHTPTNSSLLNRIETQFTVHRPALHHLADEHTVAAAARARDGWIVTAVNAYHFTEGPCAKLVVIGAAAAQGAYELDTIVAVGDRGRGVVPRAAGAVRSFLDCFPALKVIVGEGERVRTVLVTGLLPDSYVWADHQLDAE